VRCFCWRDLEMCIMPEGARALWPHTVGFCGAGPRSLGPPPWGWCCPRQLQEAHCWRLLAPGIASDCLLSATEVSHCHPHVTSTPPNTERTGINQRGVWTCKCHGECCNSTMAVWPKSAGSWIFIRTDQPRRGEFLAFHKHYV